MGLVSARAIFSQMDTKMFGKSSLNTEEHKLPLPSQYTSFNKYVLQQNRDPSSTGCTHSVHTRGRCRVISFPAPPLPCIALMKNSSQEFRD